MSKDDDKMNIQAYIDISAIKATIKTLQWIATGTACAILTLAIPVSVYLIHQNSATDLMAYNIKEIAGEVRIIHKERDSDHEIIREDHDSIIEIKEFIGYHHSRIDRIENKKS